ncbi:MAG TPA: malate dehydrogenase [Thermomicrobiales bacterium]|nr:malate dehydrogenase [Thermomicrobiales bacterium]
MRSKVTVVGAGNVGSVVANEIALGGYADVVMVDIVEGMPQGKALDMLQAGPIDGYDVTITGSNGYEETAGSDVVVITSGAARKPGMSRDDLLKINMGIVRQVTEAVVAASPDAVLIVVVNPLDAMCHVAYEAAGLPKERVIGMAGVLDSARFRTFVAMELGVAASDVQALVLGGHGDTMVPLPRYTTVAGIPITELMSEERIKELSERTANGGAEIVSLLKSGSAYYAPGAAAAQMVEAIIHDRDRVLPCSVLLEGEYGINGLFVGVPVKLGAGGIKQIYELSLTDEEQAMLNHSADAVRGLVEAMETLK